ncbi:MAG: universal stress protein [Chloroflexi bacterium]|nr:universal stress protein [Chloroflexota bacterium]
MYDTGQAPTTGVHPSSAPARSQTKAWLRLYLGYAPGVGKTYAMLQDGHRRRAAGSDVVVGWVETYDRPATRQAIGDLEIVPPRVVDYRGVLVQEMDVDAVLGRRPQVALVDELAHTNVSGSKHAKRYQDVVELQEHGINVISTLNIQHLASLNDTVSLLTGVPVRETLPDWVVDGADELKLVDQTPEALLKRLRRGNLYPTTNQTSEALANFFQLDTLTTLRELTLRRTTQHANMRSGEQSLVPDVEGHPETRELVLVGIAASEQAQELVRRGVQLADRLGGMAVVLHVAQTGGNRTAEASRGYQEATRALQLARALGAEVMTISAGDVAETIVRVAAERSATQIVLGEGRETWTGRLLGRSVVRDVARRAENVEIHLVERR